MQFFSFYTLSIHLVADTAACFASDLVPNEAFTCTIYYIHVCLIIVLSIWYPILAIKITFQAVTAPQESPYFYCTTTGGTMRCSGLH